MSFKVEEAGVLPDGEGFAVLTMPLPADHWLTADGSDDPPMPFRIGVSPEREALVEAARAAARYAIRVSTDCGKILDFDPDAMVTNVIVGLFGYWTPDGLSHISDEVMK